MQVCCINFYVLQRVDGTFVEVMPRHANGPQKGCDTVFVWPEVAG